MKYGEIAKLTEELSACYEELALLHGLTDRLRPFDDVDRVARTVLDALVEALGVRRAFILLVKEPEPVQFRFLAVAGAAAGVEAPIDDGITREAIAGGIGLIVNDVTSDPRFRPYPFPITSLLCVPLKGRSPSVNDVLGALNVADRLDGQGFTSGDLKLVQTVAGLAGAALENALLVRDLQQANRRILEQQEAMIRAEKLSSLGRMAAGVAHELRNPLAVISGRAQLLQVNARDGRPPSPEQIDRALTSIDEQAQRAVRIIAGLSTYARERPPELGAVALAEVIKAVLELVQPQVRMDGLEVRTEIEPGLPAIRGNRDQLQQVFINLMVNAAQAMAGGGRLAISAREDEGSVVVAVADTGSGIAPEHLTKIFDPFFTTKPEGEGTGLGLSIIQGIVENHGGRISVASVVGEGTTFTLRFPTLHAGAQAPDARLLGDGAMAVILILDDEAEILATLREAFEREGHRVLTRESVRQAVALVRQSGAAVVITDIFMSGGDGVEAIAALRTQCPDVCVFAMSAAGFQPTDYLHRVLGPGRIIPKPFDCRQVVAMVHEALDHAVRRRPAP